MYPLLSPFSPLSNTISVTTEPLSLTPSFFGDSTPSPTNHVLPNPFPAQSMMASTFPPPSTFLPLPTAAFPTVIMPSGPSSAVTNFFPAMPPSTFLLLPWKIRLQIYRHVIGHDNAQVEFPLSSHTKSPVSSDSEARDQNVRLWLEIPESADGFEGPKPIAPTPPGCTNLLLTSRQIFWEVFPIFCNETVFLFQLGGGSEWLRVLEIRSRPQLFCSMMNLDASIIWDSASPYHVKAFLELFALPFRRRNFRIRVTVLKPSTRFMVEQWFVDGIAGLKALDNVFICFHFRPEQSNELTDHFWHIEEGVEYALGPAKKNRCGLHFRPNSYQRMVRQTERKQRRIQSAVQAWAEDVQAQMSADET